MVRIEGVDKYLKRNPSSSFVAVCGDKLIGVILCGAEGINKVLLVAFKKNEAETGSGNHRDPQYVKT